MVVDGLGRNEQPGRDLVVGEPVREPDQDLVLASRQAGGVGAGGGAGTLGHADAGLTEASSHDPGRGGRAECVEPLECLAPVLLLGGVREGHRRLVGAAALVPRGHRGRGVPGQLGRRGRPDEARAWGPKRTAESNARPRSTGPPSAWPTAAGASVRADDRSLPARTPRRGRGGWGEVLGLGQRRPRRVPGRGAATLPPGPRLARTSPRAR